MRKVILAVAPCAIVASPLATVANAEDTTVIKRDRNNDTTTVEKKKEKLNVLPVPHTEEKKTIIKKDND